MDGLINSTGTDYVICVAVASVPMRKFLCAAARALDFRVVALGEILLASHVVIDASKPFTSGYSFGTIHNKTSETCFHS